MSCIRIEIAVSTVSIIFFTVLATRHQLQEKLHFRPSKSLIDASNKSNTTQLFLKYAKPHFTGWLIQIVDQRFFKYQKKTFYTYKTGKKIKNIIYFTLFAQKNVILASDQPEFYELPPTSFGWYC